tara:strand:+ start:945 stop:2369 length:1425 start_codon:yes stop_codon:yes gene_type:complete
MAYIGKSTPRDEDTVSKSAGGTFGGDVGVTGTLTATSFSGNGSALTGLPSSGLSDIIFDTTPQLGGNLDANTKNITNIGNLEVLKSGGGKIRISETTDKYVEIIGYAEGAANGSTMAFHTNQSGTSTSTERMRINHNGNVGIGTNSLPPANSAYLTVGTQDYAISHNGFSKNSYFDGSSYTAVTNSAGKLIQMGDDIVFYHAPTVAAGAAQTLDEVMSIKSATSEPILNVTGAGYGYTHGAMALKSDTGYDARVRGQGIFLFNEENDTTWYAGTPYLNTTAGSRPFDFNFQSSTTSLSAITAYSPTYTAFRIHASGVISSVAGIELGSGVDATAANTLDDYEEGTWTPTITGYSGGSTQTYSTQQGNYIKIGNQIFANFYVGLSNKGNIAGNYTGIGGLPFPTKTSIGGTGVLNRYNNLASSVSGVALEMGGGVPSWGWLTRINGTSGSADGYMGAGQLTNTSWFMGTLIYVEQ